MVARVMRRTLLDDDLTAIIRVQLIWLDGNGMTLSRVHGAPMPITGNECLILAGDMSGLSETSSASLGIG